MKPEASQKGFTLIEVLIAGMLFALVVTSISQLFSRSLVLQRRATGYMKIQENAIFVMESIAREIRVSFVRGSDGCWDTLQLTHPVNGEITYAFNVSGGQGSITRSKDGASPEQISSSDVNVTALQFCVSGIIDQDNAQARVTIPMGLSASTGKGSDTVAISLQTTISARDLTLDFND
jgi:prepilin-type N-terminal cleavage/methylation domain-containing protein